MNDDTIETLPAVRVESNLPAHASSFDLARPAWSLAQKIASTEFVPKGLRGSPEKVLAAMLTGNEMGIGPMQALSKIHVIDGKPGAASELMRALILRDGHDFWVEESSHTRVTVGIRRKGSTRDQMFTWTLDDAKRAGVGGKDVWRKYPRAMLLARATAEAARAVCPDSIAGMSYTVEELTDGDVIDPSDVVSDQAATAAAPSSGGKRKARASRAATRSSTSAAPAAPVQAEQPPLPGEDDDEITDAEIVDEPEPASEAASVDEPEDAEIVDEGDEGAAPAKMTLKQRRMLFALCHSIGVNTDEERYGWASGHLGREVSSFNELTVDDATRLIDVANAEASDE